MSFKNAVNNANTTPARTLTANGAAAHASTMNPLLDLFFVIGAVRGKKSNEYMHLFDAAMKQNSKLTMQMVLWLRDIRGGSGERQTFRNIMLHMERQYPVEVKVMIPMIAEYGRWDDLLIFNDTENKHIAFECIKNALAEKNDLCAKWMPREYRLKKGVTHRVSNENRKKTNAIAEELRNYLKLTPRNYRKLLSGLSNTVEQQMCKKEFSTIDYSKLPSLAASKYLKAFMRNDEGRYRAYLDALTKGEATINASVLYPYDVLRTAQQNGTLANAQWEALPNLLSGDTKILPMIDTSSSMNCSAGGSSTTCMDVAIALGLYLADKQQGSFHNMFLNFSTKTSMYELKGNSFTDKLNDLYSYKNSRFWGGSTNLIGAFEEVLHVARRGSVKAEDMPKYIMVLSDMEFDSGSSWSGSGNRWDKTAYQTVCQHYKDAGYDIPVIVFWNLNARPGNNPTTMHDDGVAMVSGFSPNILTAIMAGKQVDPVSIMLNAIDAPRYRVFG